MHAQRRGTRGVAEQCAWVGGPALGNTRLPSLQVASGSAASRAGMSFSTPAKAPAAVRFLPPWYRRCLPSCTNAFCSVGGVPTGRLLMTCVEEEQKRDGRHGQLAQRERCRAGDA